MSQYRRQLLYSKPQEIPNYLCFTAIDKGTFTLSIPSGITTANIDYIEYSVDDCCTWIKTDNVANTAVTITTPEIKAGKKVYWRGIGKRMGNSASVYSTFSSTGRFNVSGNVSSILYNKVMTSSTNTLNTYGLFGLFYNCDTLINAKNLIIPFATVNESGCRRMFYSCSNLLTAPELPASTIGTYVYQETFRACSKLIKAPTILPALTLTDHCYYSMFAECSVLEVAPELPALSTTSWCYRQMFQNCSKLKYIKMLATTLGGSYAVTSWVASVQTTAGTFIRHPNATWALSNIPNGWTWWNGTESELPTVTFADPEVHRIMLERFGGYNGGTAAKDYRYENIKRGGYTDSVILKVQVEAITSLYSYFQNNTKIEYFNDLPLLTRFTTIASNTFYGCSNLKEVDCRNITGSGTLSNVFRGCTSLYKLVTPNWAGTLSVTGNTNDSRGMFKGCSSLKRFIWPKLVTLANPDSGGTGVFSPTVCDFGPSLSSFTGNCSRFKSTTILIMRNETPPTFGTITSITAAKIYVPEASVDTYKEAAVWSTKASIIYPIGGEEWIADYGSSDQYANLTQEEQEINYPIVEEATE